jgi:biopolymer transport protein ExbD
MSFASLYKHETYGRNIFSQSTSQPAGKVRSKKQSTKIDMTPMVDLAFLLLTFFILTDTFVRPGIISLIMPEPLTDITQLQPLAAEKAFNVVLAPDNRIYWWIGIEGPPVSTNYSKEGVRKILLQKSGANPNLMVLIKPMDKSRYENVVDVLDELNITRISRYAIVDFTEDDRAILAKVSE